MEDILRRRKNRVRPARREATETRSARFPAWPDSQEWRGRGIPRRRNALSASDGRRGGLRLAGGAYPIARAAVMGAEDEPRGRFPDSRHSREQTLPADRAIGE